ncbi:MAG TPA: GNAT family protein [Homoserinimonas sp.]|nr:GNAT family protein [Homoserinimonas sp.]
MTAHRPEPAPLIGDFIRLDPLTFDDLPALYAAIGHPVIFSWGYGGGLAAFRETEAEFVEWAKGHYRFDTGIPYAVRLIGGPHDGELVGTSTLGDFDLRREAAHIGWTAYDPRVWGTAVNAEAKLLMLAHAFACGFGRVKIQTDVLNARSRAAIAGIGATFEGILRRDQPRADGTWRDTAVFSVLADEWPQVRGKLQERLARNAGRPVLYRSRIE